MSIKKIIQSKSFYLVNGIGSSDTTFVVRGCFDTRGNQLDIANDGSEIFYGAIDPKSGSRAESFSATGITYNSNGTQTITGITRNLNPDKDGSALTPNITHNAGAEIILSNTAKFYDTFLNANEDETITGNYTFTQPVKGVSAVDNDDYATKQQVVDLATDGAKLNALIQSGIAEEAILQNQVVYFNETTQKWKVLYSLDSTYLNKTIGIALSNASINQSITEGVVVKGKITGLSGLTTGAVYVNNTGYTSSTQGTVKIEIGQSLSATEMYFYGSDKTRLSANEIDGLRNAEVSLSSTNPVLTQDKIYTDGISVSQLTSNASVEFGETDATGNNNKIYQSFVAGKESIKSIILKKKASGGIPASTISVNIFADSGGSPTGSSLASGTITATDYNTIATDAEFTISLASVLSVSTETIYWVELSQATPSNTNYPNLAYQNTAVSGFTLKKWNTTDGYVSVTGALYLKVMEDCGEKLAQYKILFSNYFGDGSDGDIIISSDTNLTRDMYYNNLTINSTKTLNANGYTIFVKNTLTNNGTITNSFLSNGGIAGTIGLGVGGNGGDTFIGGEGGGSRTSLGGNSDGNSLDFINNNIYFLNYFNLLLNKLSLIYFNNKILGGSGGAGGRGGTSTPGVSGGRGRKTLFLLAYSIVGSGNINLSGENGNNGNNVGGYDTAGDGSGAGGGGSLVIITKNTFSMTTNLSGGIGGTKGTGYINGIDGENGYSGNVYQIKV